MSVLAAVEDLASRAYGQRVGEDGVLCIEHARDVAEGLALFGEPLRMAGLLCRVLEVTSWTAEDLLREQVPVRVVRIVERISGEPGAPYEERMKAVSQFPLGALVEIASNACASRSDRLDRLDAVQRVFRAAQYRTARDVLWPVIPPEHVLRIVMVTNESLVAEVHERCDFEPMRWRIDPYRWNTPSTVR